MEAAWFLEWELSRLRCDTALILLMQVSEHRELNALGSAHT